jgi:hypothetical protein
MKTNMKRLIKLLAASLCALALTVGIAAAAPGTGAASFGLTNLLLAAGTTYTNTAYSVFYGATSLSNMTLSAVDVRYNRQVTLWMSGSILCSNQHTVTITILPGVSTGSSADPLSDAPLLTWVFLPPFTGTAGTKETNAFLASTNLDVGALTQLNVLTVLDSSASGTFGGVTNGSINADTKNAQFPQ